MFRNRRKFSAIYNDNPEWFIMTIQSDNTRYVNLHDIHNNILRINFKTFETNFPKKVSEVLGKSWRRFGEVMYVPKL